MDQTLPWNGSCIRCKAEKFRLGTTRRLRFTPWCWGSCVSPISCPTAHQVWMARVRTSQNFHLPWRTTLTTYILISPLLEESPNSSVSSQSTLLKPWRRTDLHFMFWLSSEQLSFWYWLLCAWVFTSQASQTPGNSEGTQQECWPLTGLFKFDLLVFKSTIKNNDNYLICLVSFPSWKTFSCEWMHKIGKLW